MFDSRNWNISEAYSCASQDNLLAKRRRIMLGRLAWFTGGVIAGYMAREAISEVMEEITDAWNERRTNDDTMAERELEPLPDARSGHSA